jgi:serine/threonine-protein kinase
MLGTVLNGYQIIAKIKDGSVGTVWKGRNPFNEDVAIKVLGSQHVRNARKRREFRNEAKIAHSLHHEAIIKVHRFLDADPQPFYVMEYFDSENLKYALANLNDRIRGKEFRILIAICDALHYVHQRGVVHLDVKPENVLISASSEIRLIDFSIARTWWGRLLRMGRSKWGGTPGYMAPEQILGRLVTPATDQYAFGVLAYEMLTRRTPFAATHCAALLDKHLGQSPPPLRSHVRTMPADIDRIVMRMLEKRPRDRWADMAAVSYELGRLRDKYGTWYLVATSGGGDRGVRGPATPDGGAPTAAPARAPTPDAPAEPKSGAPKDPDAVRRTVASTETDLLAHPDSESKPKP